MSPPSLHDLQAGFWRSLHEGEADPVLASVVLPSPVLTPGDRIGIYQGMYFWRLVEVLREDYPKLHEVLGDDFERLVRRYLACHPSENPSVRHLGRHLPTFVADDPLVERRPWLADLARLELARTDAFDAPDATPLRAADLCVVAPEDWPGLRFELIAAIDVIRSAWPVHRVWAEPTVAVSESPTILRVWRQDFRVFHAAIDAAEDAAFSVVTAGGRFEAVCEALAIHVGPEAAPGEAGSLLARWIENGLVATFAS
jgi:hypothetical protein